MRQPIRYAALGVALLTILGATLTACGSGTYKGLTKAEFLRRANEGCARPSKGGQALRKELAVELVPERKATLYLKTLPLLNHEIDRIAALKPPKADRDRVKEILEAVRTDADDFETHLKADPKAAVTSGGRPFGKSERLATSYGLRICAE